MSSKVRSTALHLSSRADVTTHSRSKDGWKAWKNGSGQVSNIIEHLERAHWQTYRSRVIAHGLKHYEDLLKSEEEKGSCRRDRPPFTVEGFRNRLLRFMTVYDQVGAFYSRNVQY